MKGDYRAAWLKTEAEEWCAAWSVIKKMPAVPSKPISQIRGGRPKAFTDDELVEIIGQYAWSEETAAIFSMIHRKFIDPIKPTARASLHANVTRLCVEGRMIRVEEAGEPFRYYVPNPEPAAPAVTEVE